MLKILFFHHYNDYSGSTKVLSDNIRFVFKDDINNLIITDNSKEGFLTGIRTPIKNVKILRIENHAIPLISQVYWFIMGFFKALYFGRNYDIFYINTIVPCYAPLAAKILRKRVIYHIHEKFVDKKINHIVSEYIFNHSRAKRIFVSKYVEKQYPTRVDCPSKVIYNKLSPEFISKVKIKCIEERSFNKVLLISSLQEEKGILNYRELAKNLPNLTFILVVSSEKSEISSFFHNDIPTNLIVFPKQDNIHPFLYDADVVLNLSIPSKWVETFGLTIIEAMAYGLPTIVPNIGGPLELVNNGITGYTIDVEDYTQLISKLKLILSPQNYAKMSEATLKLSKSFIMNDIDYDFIFDN